MNPTNPNDPFWIAMSGLLMALITYLAGLQHGSSREGHRRNKRDEHLLIAAKNAASKLNIEMQRGSCQPKAEYDLLIDEAEKHRFK